MGLDLYVGSLTRYFARDWKTALEQLAEQGDLPEVRIVRPERPEGAEDVVTDPVQIRDAVLAWRRGLSAGLAAHLSSPLDWDEGAGTPYFTDKPAWDCYGALVLWAAYCEHPELSRPTGNPLCAANRTAGDWRGDPAYRRSVAEGFATRFGQLLRGAEVWLPARFDFTFDAQWVNGSALRFGSCAALAAQLDELNAVSWRAGPDDLARWRRNGADYGAPLETGARFAFSILRDLAGKATEHRLPLLLDY